MAAIVSLQDYRQQRRGPEPADVDAIPRPAITDSDIWGRDYGRAGEVVAGLFKIREILNFHLHGEEEWKHYLLCLLDAHFHRRRNAVEVVGVFLARLKHYLGLVMDEENHMDLKRALVILDLMDKKKELALAV